jgi:hypothetical protein
MRPCRRRRREHKRQHTEGDYYDHGLKRAREHGRQW